MSLLRLAWASLVNRRLTAALAILAIAMSVALLLSVEKVRRDARTSFTNTVSDVDLVVGARSGAIQLLLYSVFRIGDATNNVSWESYTEITERPEVRWAVPLSLGDSHRGYRVLGTSAAYFEHYRHGDGRALRFAAGGPSGDADGEAGTDPFGDLFDAVLGSEVARALDYTVGDPIVVAHGTGRVGIALHDDQPFRVAAVLAPTGTPVDRTVHVSLEGIEAMHVDWRGGRTDPRSEHRPRHLARGDAPAARRHRLPARTRLPALGPARAAPDQRVPRGAAPRRAARGRAPRALEPRRRRRAGAPDRLVVRRRRRPRQPRLRPAREPRGASPGDRDPARLGRAPGPRVRAARPPRRVSWGVAGIVGGLALHYAVVTAGGFWLERRFGLAVSVGLPTPSDWAMLGAILVAAVLVGCLPAWRAYRSSLADGMTVRI